MSNHSINDTQGKGKGERAVEQQTTRPSENKQPSPNDQVRKILNKE